VVEEVEEDDLASSAHSEIPESILSKIDAALELKHQDELRRATEDIVADLKVLSSDIDDAQIDYLLGYVWYIHPDRQHSNQIQEASDKALLAAVSKDPDKALAWLYLGHNAYDLGRYEMAEERFLKVDLQQLSPYLGAKAQEMILCCRIRLHGLGRCLKELDKFVSMAEELEGQDLWPQELARVLGEAKGGIGEFDRARARVAARRLDELGRFGDWFDSLL